jgi:hypothetical protein
MALNTPTTGISANPKSGLRAQRSLSRKPIGSANYNKAKRKAAVLHEKIANQRNDNLHKLSTQIVREHDIITGNSSSAWTRSTRAANCAATAGIRSRSSRA